MSGVRGPHAAEPLVAVERDAVAPQLLVPERLLEPLAQPLGLGSKLAGAPVVAERGGEVGGGVARGEDVALDLAQRDRALGERSIGVEDRVVRVLPALLHQAGRLLPGVLDEAVVVRVRRAVDPGQRGLDVRPEVAGKLEVAGVAVVRAGEHHEQRRRVVAAVVAPERDLHQRRHLAVAQLVQDLAGLGVALRVVFGGLQCRRGASGRRGRAWAGPTASGTR